MKQRDNGGRRQWREETMEGGDNGGRGQRRATLRIVLTVTGIPD